MYSLAALVAKATLLAPSVSVTSDELLLWMPRTRSGGMDRWELKMELEWI
jgi:hypothetical protein